MLQKMLAWMLLVPTLMSPAAAPEVDDPTPPVEETVVTRTVDEAAGDFAVRLLGATMEDGKNTLVSPLSVLTALSMTANGAAGDTQAQMEKTLGASAADYNAYLETYAETAPQGEGCELHLANGLWVKDDPKLTVHQDFLDTVQAHYDAEVRTVPFNRATVRTINSFVAQHTKNRIKKIVEELPEDAMLCLVNALAFDGTWAEVYETHDVRDGVFTTEAGETRKVELMHSTEWDFLEDDQATGFLKPYEGGEFAFLALLPNEGVRVADYVNGLTGEHLAELVKEPQSIMTYAAMPKFKAEFSTSLKEPLKTMGMPLAFDPLLADFSAMGTYDMKNALGDLYISDVLHKTFLEVDEQGTKAGAATAVIMFGPTSAAPPEESRTVTLDRPFVYGIVDLRTNLPVFLGVQMDVT